MCTPINPPFKPSEITSGYADMFKHLLGSLELAMICTEIGGFKWHTTITALTYVILVSLFCIMLRRMSRRRESRQRWLEIDVRECGGDRGD